ncbi:MAG: hypothetical protein QOK30_2004 [Nocardioidaceae bacterium]|nr:hypothetical protein [Nocardioidaceae bacterium]
MLIPLEGIAGQAGVVYDSPSHWRNSRPDAGQVPEVPPRSDFTPFDPATDEELTEVPRYARATSSSSEMPGLRQSVAARVLAAAEESLSGHRTPHCGAGLTRAFNSG